MDQSLTEIWKSNLPKIKEKIGEASFETWFTTLAVIEKNNKLIIETPDEFFKNWMIEHYYHLIIEILNDNLNESVVIEIVVNPSLINEKTQDNLTPVEKNYNFDHSYQKQNLNLNENFNFDNFVIGPSNRFAASASLAVAESPAKTYNPLFIYGEVGLGKTHLLQAITHKIQSLHSDQKICYISSENFTNELIDSIRNRTTSAFRKKYRNIDVLLIDDIQFIAGKESTQEEFFHTFNNLHNNRKQIIITSDRPPKEISKLEERLISRFAWGLITDIQPPDFETRVAILRKKTENDQLKVPSEVINFIAEEIKTNIRELEGALIRVAAFSVLEEKSLTLDIARHVLKDMVKESSKIISVEMIQKHVSDFFNIAVEEMKTKKRSKNIVIPRQIAMYLSRQLTSMSLPEIGQAFGGKDHTTVMHSCRKIEDQIDKDEKTQNIIRELTTGLQQ